MQTIPIMYQVIFARYHMIPLRYSAISTTYRVILTRYQMIPARYQELGIKASAAAAPCPPPSTLHTEPEPRRWQPHPPPSTVLSRPRSTSKLVAGDHVLRQELITGGRVRRPHLSRWQRPPRRSSSPVPSPSPRRILRYPRPTPELVVSAVSITTQDPPPSMRPCPTPELAGGRVLHAGAHRRHCFHHHVAISCYIERASCGKEEHLVGGTVYRSLAFL
ncbi:Os05g0475851 [Oryza sativa Japonica Group]|uniref:Os05g0475851 protein n=1 Tax=Oryza sativa subsp. japonica TaxID=39947 RepID=A0A0N7KKY7_ORYSJ|nr:Os05g0475851 [Oryza sativa Japonica Group]